MDRSGGINWREIELVDGWGGVCFVRRCGRWEREKKKVQVIWVNWKRGRRAGEREISIPSSPVESLAGWWKTIPSLRYQVFSGLAKASTMHCNRTWLSTGAATNWLTALTVGGTAKREGKVKTNFQLINHSQRTNNGEWFVCFPKLHRLAKFNNSLIFPELGLTSRWSRFLKAKKSREKSL